MEQTLIEKQQNKGYSKVASAMGGVLTGFVLMILCSIIVPTFGFDLLYVFVALIAFMLVLSSILAYLMPIRKRFFMSASIGILIALPFVLSVFIGRAFSGVHWAF